MPIMFTCMHAFASLYEHMQLHVFSLLPSLIPHCQPSSVHIGPRTLSPRWLLWVQRPSWMMPSPPPPPNDFSANDDDRNDETVAVIPQPQPQQQHDDKQLMNTMKLMSISCILLPLSSTRINHRYCGTFHGHCLPVWIRRSRSGSIGSLSILGKTWSGYRNWELGTSYMNILCLVVLGS